MDRGETTAILTRARDGSEEDLSLLFARYGERLLSLIRLRMGPPLRARLESRDILQATLLKAFQDLDHFAGQGSTSFLAWLVRIAENEIRDQADFHRRQRRDVARETGLSAPQAALAARVRSALSQLLVGEERRRLESALESLSPEHREVIVLRRLMELSYPEIGERLGKSPDACRMLFARAMAAVTLALEEGE